MMVKYQGRKLHEAIDLLDIDFRESEIRIYLISGQERRW